jgi:hypothetical protein
MKRDLLRSALAKDVVEVSAVIPHLWHPLLRMWPGTLCFVRAGFCRGLLVQGPGCLSLLQRFGSALNHHVHLHACATDGVFVPTGDGPPALLRVSCLPKTVAGPADHLGRSGRIQPDRFRLLRTIIFRRTLCSWDDGRSSTPR